MKRIGILILLLPVCVFADIGFHPKESNILFTPKTTTNLLNFSLLQISDISDDSSEEKNSLYKYSYEAMGGFLGAVLGALIGGGIVTIGLYMLGGVYFCTADYTPEFGFLLGAPLGGIIGLPKGVGIAGKQLGEEGSYWKTFLGTLIGTGAGLLVGGSICALMDEERAGVVETILGTGVGIFSVAGAVWGYHW